MASTGLELSSQTFAAPHETEALVPGKFSSFNVKANRRLYHQMVTKHELDALYIKALEDVLREHNIELPSKASEIDMLTPAKSFREKQEEEGVLMKDGSIAALHKVLDKVKDFHDTLEVHVQFKNLSYFCMAPEAQIPTVGSTLKKMIMGSGPKQRIDILKDLTGRILQGKMTLIMGPPGCGMYLTEHIYSMHSLALLLIFQFHIVSLGKSSLLKALSGKLNTGSTKLDGTITYNGDSVTSGKFLLPKIADYVDEKEQHAATLTVQETMEFAWAATSNNRHSYGVTRTPEGEAALGALDAVKAKVCCSSHLIGHLWSTFNSSCTVFSVLDVVVL
jgi:hypothetical protein